MPVSALQSGYQMLQHSNQMVDDSSRELNRARHQYQDNTAQSTPVKTPAAQPLDPANKADASSQQKARHQRPLMMSMH
ncbi:hypothetical protein P4S72_12635 [Vibrio sp. PP-XX7]